MSSEVREQIERDLAEGRPRAAFAGLGELWRGQPTTATAQYVLRQAEGLRASVAPTPFRLAILRSFTVEPLVPLLRAAAFVGGIDLQVQVGAFNAYAQEILDPESPLYRFGPDAVALAVQTRDLAPELWTRFASLREAERREAGERAAATIEGLVERFRERSAAGIILQTLEMPPLPAQGALDAQDEAGQLATIREINRALARTAASHRGVHLLDYDEVIAGFGRSRWYDERRWLTMRLPMTAEAMNALVAAWLRVLHPLAGRLCKVLVTDLDNTLWGGVIGEDGLDGLRLGGEYPGAAFQEVQRALLDLRERGILLAVCSKNNPAEAMEALERHPGMLLRPAHFAAMRINWIDKAENLRDIARELNLGLDSLAFLDDNPAERARVRDELPEVAVLELPADPMGYAGAIRACPRFERLSLSTEDRERGRHYAEQRQREELQQATASLDEFYRSLAQRVEIGPAREADFARVAQLTQKTNQFNVTTRRYSEPQIAAMAADPRWRVYAARVADRFGDHGLVGVLLVHDAAEGWEIDTFLLSCRVIGRTVETALLAFLAEEARAAGVDRLLGWFLPTAKNAPARDVYASHQFQLARTEGDGSRWTLDLNAVRPACPPWIELSSGTGALSS